MRYRAAGVHKLLANFKPLVQLYAMMMSLYTDPESHNAERYRRTDGQTEYTMMSVADPTV